MITGHLRCFPSGKCNSSSTSFPSPKSDVLKTPFPGCWSIPKDRINRGIVEVFPGTGYFVTLVRYLMRMFATFSLLKSTAVSVHPQNTKIVHFVVVSHYCKPFGDYKKRNVEIIYFITPSQVTLLNL